MKNQNIQALRGIAILSVALFHFTYRWRDKFVYEYWVDKSYLQIGSLGVSLFFVISGYVIFESLEKTPNFKVFLRKRIMRLIPPLLLIAPSLYLFQNCINLGIFPTLNFVDIFTSILIINPSIFQFIFGIKINFITGVMWTLTYELTFYFMISIIYFYISKKYALEILSGLATCILFSRYIYLFQTNQINQQLTVGTNSSLNLEFVLRQGGLFSLSWFLVGVWIHKSKLRTKTPFNYTLGTILIIQSFWDGIGGRSAFPISNLVMFKMLYISLIFVCIYFACKKPQPCFRNFFYTWIIKLGNISYEFYLVHEVIGVTLLAYFSSLLLNKPIIFSPFLIALVFMIVIFASNIIVNINKNYLKPFIHILFKIKFKI